ncbi:MAG: hypothetical protein ACR2H0_04205 [Candidatus Limnocylindrales bacterium]
MSTMLAALRPLRTELLGIAGLSALLLLAAGFVAARLLALDLPAACLDPESIDPACLGRRIDAMEYQAFASSWTGGIAYIATLFPAVAGVILGIAAVAKELDQRTAVLAWSVGPSRRKWLLQRVVPLLGVIALLGLGSTELFAAMMRLNNGGVDIAAIPDFEHIAVSGFGPLAGGVSAFGITIVVGAMLGRLLPGLMAAAAFVVFAALLIQQGNDRLIAGESLVADVAQAGPGRQVESVLRTPDGQILSWGDAYPQYVDPNNGQLIGGAVEMVRYAPIEILPEVAARYVLLHLLVGLTALTLAFAVVERRSP